MKDFKVAYISTQYSFICTLIQSKHIWQLKDQKKDFAISWKILAKAKSYSNLTKRCNLCSTEKFYILYKPDMATLNKRNELVSTCRHKRNFLLRFNRILNNQS